MKITAGTLLGPYEIIAHLGAGGMGTVYRARDTRLDRQVAIKLLPEELSAHAGLRERLAREAKAVSALSHPNICALFDVGSSDGSDYLVMELLEGETLADRIARGPIPQRDSLRWAAEIASALDAAHRAGIIHRDLKPGNVMLTKGRTRVLDFGLASRETEEVFESNAPTRPAPLTQPGTTVGTLPYMSPEQVQGQTLDARSDIFSFGSMLYEMLTGQRPHSGSSRIQVISAITEGQPPRPGEVNPQVPEPIDRIVMKCLEKDRDARWQTARDLADELQWVAGGSGSSAVRRRTPVTPTVRRWQIATVFLFIVAVAAMIASLRGRRADAVQPASSLRFGINPPPGFVFAQRATNSELAVSPDGSRIAFCALRGGSRSLFVRRIDELVAHELPGTEGAESPFWSPNAKWIGFLADGFLRKVQPGGGAVEKICVAQGGAATWGKSGVILFTIWGPDAPESILMVNENGGVARELTKRPGWHYWPWFLADGRHFLFLLNAGTSPQSGIYLASLEEPEGTKVLDVRSRVVATRDDVVYFVREGVLVKQQLDVSGRRMSGQAVTIAERVFNFVSTGSANFSVDASGNVLAYQREAALTQLVVRDREGHESGRLGEAMPLRSFRLSPDGRRIALDLADETTSLSDIWMYDIERNVRTRVTRSQAGTFAPIWTADGADLIVAQALRGEETEPPQLTRWNLASNTSRQLIQKGGLQIPNAVTPDGSGVIFTVDRGRKADIELLAFAGDQKRTKVVSSEFDERSAAFSSDGKWIAFTSDSSGSPEIYLRSFSGSGEEVRVSTSGGAEAQWSPHGTDLYYVAPDGMLMRVMVTPGAVIGLSRPQPLFRISSVGMMGLQEFDATHYDVEPDGQHFVVREIPEGADEASVVVIVSITAAGKQ